MASAVTTTVTLSFRLLGSLLRPLPCRLESAHTPLSGDRTPKLWLLPPGGGWEELRLAMVPMAGQVRPAGHLQAWQSELAHTCAGEQAAFSVAREVGASGWRLGWTEGLSRGAGRAPSGWSHAAGTEPQAGGAGGLDRAPRW